VAAGWAVEEIFAEFALNFRQALTFFALGADSIHLALFNIICEQEAAAWTGLEPAAGDPGVAVGIGADENRLAMAAPVFSFLGLFADRAFFHGIHLYLTAKGQTVHGTATGACCLNSHANKKTGPPQGPGFG
jgi:hypothetical protein